MGHGTWAMGPWAMGPWDHGPMGHGTMGHGTMGHGTMGPWAMGPGPWDLGPYFIKAGGLLTGGWGHLLTHFGVPGHPRNHDSGIILGSLGTI